MERRTFIGTVAATGSIALAGCSGILGGDDDPDAAIEAYVEAVDNGDFDDARDLIHPDSPNVEITAEEEEFFEELDYSIEEMDVVEEDDDVAVVEVTVGAEGFGEETSRMELRTDDGDWKLYEELD